MKFKIKKYELEKLYWKNKLSSIKIAKKFNISHGTVLYKMKKYKISRRTKSEALKNINKKFNLTKQNLKFLYRNKNFSTRKIAKETGFCKTTVSNWLTKYNIKKRLPTMKGRKHSIKTKNLISKKLRGRPPNDGSFKHGLNPWNKNKKGLQKRNKTSFKMGHTPWWIRKNLKNPAFLILKPTKPELKLMEIIKKYKLPFKYTGDGKVVIGGLNPDFVGIDNKKLVIELFGRVFHDPKHSFMEIPYKQTLNGRKNIYNKLGYKVLIFWDDELNKSEDFILKSIKNFCEG